LCSKLGIPAVKGKQKPRGTCQPARPGDGAGGKKVGRFCCRARALSGRGNYSAGGTFLQWPSARIVSHRPHVSNRFTPRNARVGTKSIPVSQ